MVIIELKVLIVLITTALMVVISDYIKGGDD